MLVNHGWGKLMRFFGDDPIKFADPIGIGENASLVLATFAEVLCAVLIIVGLFTRLATIPLIVTMAVAIFFVHLSDPFKQMESAIVFLSGYLAIAALGSGRFSIDGIRNRHSV